MRMERKQITSLVAALIHDVVEDTSLTLTDVEEEFGYEVGQIVDGVTKIGRVEFRSHMNSRSRTTESSSCPWRKTPG